MIRLYQAEKYYRRAVQLFGSHLYIDANRDTGKSILVAGAARSGTTWLAELISAQIPSRMMFEPFNPDLVSEYQKFQYFQYMRPGQQDEALAAFARKVFSGEIRNPWIDRKNERLLPRFRLIKEIRANLLLKWLHDCFPEVPFVFIIRHPCAVVLSRMELGWATDGDIEPFLKQPDLMTDYLSEHIELMEHAQSDEEKHAVIWCVSNLIPLQQFQPNEIKIVFYENLCMDTEKELSNLMDYLPHGDKHLHKIKPNRPSSTSRMNSAVVTGNDRISGWKNRLDHSQISKILKIVSAFGLDYLYGESLLPAQIEH